MSPKKHKYTPNQETSGPAQSSDFYEQLSNVQNLEDVAADTDQMTDEELLQSCRERICPQCPELAKERDDKLRALADVENVKKRLQREKEDFCKFAAQSVLEDLVPILDNLDLALEHGRKIKGCEDLAQGVEMTRKIFLDILARHDMEPMGEPGEVFDPTWHEALGQQPQPDMEPGRICQLVQKGYRLKGRLLRPAKVLVSQECA